jgi:type I restriction enzyme S subunit
MNVLENLHITIPPLIEQQAIAIYLDDKTTKIDTLVDKATQSIDLLKEKRVAIISAAVTGKIDVRGVV